MNYVPRLKFNKQHCIADADGCKSFVFCFWQEIATEQEWSLTSSFERCWEASKHESGTPTSWSKKVKDRPTSCHVTAHPWPACIKRQLCNKPQSIKKQEWRNKRECNKNTTTVLQHGLFNQPRFDWWLCWRHSTTSGRVEAAVVNWSAKPVGKRESHW